MGGLTDEPNKLFRVSDQTSLRVHSGFPTGFNGKLQLSINSDTSRLYPSLPYTTLDR